MLRSRWHAAMLGALVAMSGCASQPIAPRGTVRDEAAYDVLHPYYLEYCAWSEVAKKPGYGAAIRSGFGGHSSIFLNGVCRVGEGYPEIALCTEGTEMDGVGLSINAHFANANWVAVPGRQFFYHGDLQPGQTLDRPTYDATKAHAARLGIYNSVRFHDRVFDDMPAGYGRAAYEYEVSIATDYAIGYGRDRYCARVPVSRPQMTRIAAYLNGLNRPYRDGPAQYEWDVVNDNCIHVAHNALTAAGFWPGWPTHRFVLLAALDFPVPKNEFVNVARRANDMPLDDLLAVWDDRTIRRSVLAGDGLPTRPGALATLEPVTRPNDLYETNLRLVFYDERLLGPYEGWYRHIASDPRYAEIDANARHFAALYARIDAERQPLEWWLRTHPRLRSERDFPPFYQRFYEAMSADALARGRTPDPASGADRAAVKPVRSAGS